MKSMAIPTEGELRERLAVLETQMEVLITANPQLEQFKRKKIYMICSISYADREQANQARLMLNTLNGSLSQWLGKIGDAIIAMTSDKDDAKRYMCEISLHTRPNAAVMAQAELLNSLGVEMFDGIYRGWHVAIPDHPSFRLTPSGIRPS